MFPSSYKFFTAFIIITIFQTVNGTPIPGPAPNPDPSPAQPLQDPNHDCKLWGTKTCARLCSRGMSVVDDAACGGCEFDEMQWT
ncbi:uncharacterized protein FA14DRAFT_177820 [Meira miltonrushii]|uniref:Uncharacterized protein n=1 Tax=Meira miltonrushii TaxID=1280837 RepID=A0A316VLW2_9BASI|nr:uncharacterized protein FA14DRAFT_177820 [Meira miltonrushii]PWN38556.1 hypothetical protein FA14DRAFT_177820 [Meira miltonrushii]